MLFGPEDHLCFLNGIEHRRVEGGREGPYSPLGTGFLAKISEAFEE